MAQNANGPAADGGAARVWALAAHDLRQPVQTARLLAATLDRAAGQELVRLAQGIDSALESLQEMLEVLALLARVQAGLQVVALGSCELAEALGPPLRELAAIAAGHGIPLRMRKPRGTVRSHSKLLAIVARSLFLNAVRFGEGSEIHIGCRRARGRLCLEVAFGGAAPDAAVEKNAFVQLLPSAGSQGVVELGLGLPLLRHLCPIIEAELQHTGVTPVRRLLALTLPGR